MSVSGGSGAASLASLRPRAAAPYDTGGSSEKGLQLIVVARRAAGAPVSRLTLGLRASVLAGLLCCSVLLAPTAAHALGPNAVLYPTGWNANAVARGDDTANLVVNLPFAMDWMGTNYNQLYLNMNGNVTFTSGFTSYTPGALTGVGQGVMAPFWADVDTRYVGAPNLLYYSNITSGSVPSVNGHQAFLVTWSVVQYYNAGNITSQTTTDTFQLIIVDRSDTGSGNFDFMYNYDQMLWDMGTASSTHARAGWAVNGTNSFELPGSGTNGGLLDSGAAGTSLIKNSLNSGGQLGRYVWQVRGGTAPNAPPVVTVTDRTLEGNDIDSYTGYTGAGDATASDGDGTIVSFTSNLPTVLPLGTTTVTWSATDNDGAVTTQTQSILVHDTTPPSLPALMCSTHTTGIWSNSPTVTVASTDSTDVCSGVDGASYVWSLGATAAPDGTLDASTIATVNVTTTTTVDSQTFATATWPADWIRSDATYARLTNTAGRNHGTYAAEVWANSTTRRTVNLYKDYNLSTYQSATLNFWDNVSPLTGGTDYARVEYSTDGGTTYTQLQSLTATSTWTQRSYSLPVGGTVRIRFSASVNATTEYADWDDIVVQGFVTDSFASLSTNTTNVLADGTWYFNIRAVDDVGNWTSTRSLGPILIDRFPPVTTDNAPTTWKTAPVTVSLIATDAGSGVVNTWYRVNSGAVTTYTAPFVVSAEQTNTVQYWSVDARGNSETTKSVNVRIDSGPPSVPGGFSASAVTTTGVEVGWSASTDATSGMSYYRVYANGSLVATSSTTSCTVTGLTPGLTYGFWVNAVDVAGNVSAHSTTDTETMPAAQIWLTIDPTAISLGSVDPGIVSSYTSATAVSVGGVGVFTYDFSCSCQNFSNVATASLTPTMPASLMSYRMYGSGAVPLTPFGTTTQPLATATGTKYMWIRPYFFDFTLNVPWAYSPGTYVTQVTYTAVAR